MIDEETLPKARNRKWTPTLVAELYIFIGIIICIENYPEKTLPTYWASKPSDADAFYPFTRYMSLCRFELLLARTRVYSDLEVEGLRKRKRGEEIPTIYYRVNDWSDLI